jgi:hypothetical protein
MMCFVRGAQNEASEMRSMVNIGVLSGLTLWRASGFASM